LLIAHFADTHIGARLYGFDWTFESILEHFKQAVEKALEERVDAIIFSGDFFDKPRPPNRALKTAIEVVQRAVERGVRVYSVLGEHDLPKVADIPPQHLIPGLRTPLREEGFVDCFTAGGLEYCVGGVNHIPLKYSRELRVRLLNTIASIVSRMGRRSVLALHQNIVNFERFEPGLELADLPDKPMYVAMGHIHRRITHVREGGQVVAYPGSLDILRRDEIAEWKRSGKGFYIVDLSGDAARVERVDVEVTPQELVESDLQSLEKSVARALSSLPRDRRSILHVIVQLKPNERVDASSLVRSIVARYSQSISVRVEKRYVEGAEATTPGSLESVDEIEAIAEALGGSQYRELAEKIYMLKRALVEGDESSVEKLVEEITSYSYWSTKVRPPQITLPAGVRQASSLQSSPSSRQHAGGRSLLSYMQR